MFDIRVLQDSYHRACGKEFKWGVLDEQIIQSMAQDLRCDVLELKDELANMSSEEIHEHIVNHRPEQKYFSDW